MIYEESNVDESNAFLLEDISDVWRIKYEPAILDYSETLFELFNHFNDNNRMSSSQVFATFFVYEYFLVTPISNYPIANEPNDDEPLSKNLFVAN
jgi:hypothetical protein